MVWVKSLKFADFFCILSSFLKCMLNFNICLGLENLPHHPCWLCSISYTCVFPNLLNLQGGPPLPTRPSWEWLVYYITQFLTEQGGYDEVHAKNCSPVLSMNTWPSESVCWQHIYSWPVCVCVCTHRVMHCIPSWLNVYNVWTMGSPSAAPLLLVFSSSWFNRFTFYLQMRKKHSLLRKHLVWFWPIGIVGNKVLVNTFIRGRIHFLSVSEFLPVTMTVKTPTAPPDVGSKDKLLSLNNNVFSALFVLFLHTKSLREKKAFNTGKRK